MRLSRIAKEIAKALSLTHHKELAYNLITQNGFHMLVGLCVEPDPYTSEEFAVQYFIQELYVPCNFIAFSIGDRVGKWEKKDLPLALPVIRKYYEQRQYDSIAKVVDDVKNHKLKNWAAIGVRYEFFAYSYLVLNRYREARDYLNQIVDFESEIKDSEWVEKRKKRAKHLLNLMDHEEWQQIKEQLLEWQRYTMTELKLPEQ